jgi:glycosyltransferase involved in cell wall biosynthesis
LTRVVSVIIAVFNGEKYVAEAIQSALNQDCDQRLEIIVVDDGSSDETVKVASRFAGVTVISKANGGQSEARNVGIARATGDYLVFLDHDDILVPGSFHINARFLDRNPNIGFVAGGMMSFRSSQELAELFAAIPDRTAVPELELRSYLELQRGRTFVPPSMCMFRRELVQRAGGFRRFAGGEDLDLFVRVAREGSVGVHSYPCAFYRRHSTNLSRNVAVMLESTLSVLELHRLESGGNAEELAAIDAGRHHWIRLLRPQLLPKAFWAAKELRFRDAAHSLSVWYSLRHD